MANNQNLKPWKKGQSANPDGKPKAVSERDWIIARRHTGEAVEKILEFMRGEVTTIENGQATKYKSPPQLQLQAAGMILDRGWGKPPQVVYVTDDDNQETVQELTEQEALEFIRNSIESIAARIDQEQTAQLRVKS